MAKTLMEQLEGMEARLTDHLETIAKTLVHLFHPDPKPPKPRRLSLVSTGLLVLLVAGAVLAVAHENTPNLNVSLVPPVTHHSTSVSPSPRQAAKPPSPVTQQQPVVVDVPRAQPTVQKTAKGQMPKPSSTSAPSPSASAGPVVSIAGDTARTLQDAIHCAEAVALASCVLSLSH